ncbi:response regulator transcription factor [Microlunatus ginsengisoli]|uniref:Response regulator transcription factor n=1 Tax=Microlunatus ginsengisoli TaxID=363863 RepID=A0ABP7AXJ1_9ACTN
MSTFPDRPRPVTVLIADDQKIIRDGLALILGLLDGVSVIGTAIDGRDAVRQATAVRPDVVLMDLDMPAMNGVEATRRLAAGNPPCRVVVLTTYLDDDWVYRAIDAGARGYLTKDATPEEIRDAVVTVASGEAHLEPRVQRRLLDLLATGARNGVPTSPPGDIEDGLTARETEILVEIADGRTNAEIAQRLVISEATVKTHVNHLLLKTGCRDRAALVVYAYRSGRATP